MRVPPIPYLVASCALLSGCTYGEETLPKCFSQNIPPVQRAIEQANANKTYQGGDLQLEHDICSTYDDRLVIAERLLTSQGYETQRTIAELGNCVRVMVKSPLTSKALEQQITSLCGVSAAARVAYTGWSAALGDHFLFVSGDYVSLTGPGELPEPIARNQ